MPASRRAAVLFSLALFLGMVGCDQGSKELAERELGGGPPVTVVERVLRLELHHNPGVAFNLERVLPEGARLPLLLAVAAVAVTLLGRMWWRRRGELSATTAGLALVLAGALGNLIDRLARGAVIDFIHVSHWPVFNVADVSIALGAGLMLWGSRRRPVSGADRA